MQATAYPQQQTRMSAGFPSNPSLSAPYQGMYGIPQSQHIPMSAHLPVQASQQLRLPMHYSTSFQAQMQLPQQQINQQPFVVQNLIQPQPQLQYQQQIVQQPTIQYTQPAQVERKVNYVPKTRQVVKMQEQEIEEIVPIERTIIEYIPVQTIIEKVPVPVEIPYEVRIPKPYDQELYYPNNNNQFVTDQYGNPIDPMSQPMQEPAEQPKGSQVTYEYQVGEDENEESEDDDEADDILIEKYKRTIEQIQERKRQRNRRGRRGKGKGYSTSDDDFDIGGFSNFMKSGGGDGYGEYSSSSRARAGDGYGSRYHEGGHGGGGADSYYRQQRDSRERRGYRGKGQSARDYLNNYRS